MSIRRDETPTQQDMATSWFNGRMIWDWKSIDLRAILGILDPQGGCRRTSLKAELCRDLFEVKNRKPPTAQELRGIREFLHTRSIRAAKFIRDATSVGSSTLLSSECKAKIKAENHLADTDYDTQQCETCYDDLGVHHFPKRTNSSACKHAGATTCIDCLSAHIEQSATVNFATEIPCPDAGCDAHLSFEQMQAYASERVFTVYHSYFATQTIQGHPEFVKCASETCPSGAQVDARWSNWLICHDCNAQTCIACATLWHPEVSCEDSRVAIKQREDEESERIEEECRQAEREAAREQAELDLRKGGEEQQTAKVLPTISKRCPGKSCGVPLQKISGCDHMRCSRCKYEFCWLCLADYAPIRRAGNQNHSVECTYYRPLENSGPEETAAAGGIADEIYGQATRRQGSGWEAAARRAEWRTEPRRTLPSVAARRAQRRSLGEAWGKNRSEA